MQKLTPMMEQYLEIKEQHQDCIVFFRLGDFYEMFFDDAITASKILDITLTGKACGMEERAPMCGVPFHSAEGYIQKLILSGKKVAICEQIEDPSTAKGIVKREVIRIITPGTVLDENVISKGRNNYLMGICHHTYVQESIQEVFDVSYMDISTGDASTIEILPEDFSDLFYKVSPVEMILDQKAYEALFQKTFKNSGYFLEQIKERNITINCMEDIDKVKMTNPVLLEKYKSEGTSNSLILIYSYIEYTQKSFHIISKPSQEVKPFMVLDQFTFQNLELTETLRGGKTKGSLLWVLDNTHTPMGARMIKSWIEYPLLQKQDIEERLEYIESIYHQSLLSKDLSKVLKNIYDLERICTKLSYDTSKHHDIIKLKHSLAQIPLIKNILQTSGNQLFHTFANQFMDFQDIYSLIEDSIEEYDDYRSKNKYIIRSSFDSNLKELRDIIEHSSEMILQIEQREREAIGIKTLKIGYNKVFGYYIEITKAALKNTEHLPEDYIRKQTLASAERYINEELKTIEEKILTAKEKSEALEQILYSKVKEKIKSRVDSLLLLAKMLAKIDCYNSLAIAALENNYIKPSINENGTITIKEGRHPVVEKMIPEENFVPNDAFIHKNNIHIITGPNMAGKSTYMRQLALITLMAHIGSFVPCSSADICLIDKIFTRVGASDDLSQGQSTFMVEMSEVSHILKNATSQSLIILDEIGRGTSTYDGMSIAYSVIEYIQEKIKAKSLVSTHYHEITSLDEKYSNIENFSMAVHESADEVSFLRKIIQGKSDKSYGIHVAKLADLPLEIIEKSYKILEKLEKDHTVKLRDSFGEINIYGTEKIPDQMSFQQVVSDEIQDRIKNLNINQITPIEALQILNELKNKLG